MCVVVWLCHGVCLYARKCVDVTGCVGWIGWVWIGLGSCGWMCVEEADGWYGWVCFGWGWGWVWSGVGVREARLCLCACFRVRFAVCRSVYVLVRLCKFVCAFMSVCVRMRRHVLLRAFACAVAFACACACTCKRSSHFLMLVFVHVCVCAFVC